MGVSSIPWPMRTTDTEGQVLYNARRLSGESQAPFHVPGAFVQDRIPNEGRHTFTQSVPGQSSAPWEPHSASPRSSQRALGLLAPLELPRAVASPNLSAPASKPLARTLFDAPCSFHQHSVFPWPSTDRAQTARGGSR